MNKVIRVFFDTETYTNYKGISYPYLIGWITDLNLDKFEYSTEPHDKFFDFLSNLSEQGYTVELWAHNAQYDLGIIYPPYLAKKPHKSDKVWQSTESGLFLSFKYVGTEDNKIKFQAFCTWRWKKGSLASWAEEMKLEGVEKGIIDYEKRGYCKVGTDKIEYETPTGKVKRVDLKDELDYLKNDVFILYKLWERIAEQKKDILALYNLKMGKGKLLTMPAFGKHLLNMLMGGNEQYNIYQMTYKNKVLEKEGIQMEFTRIGGFTAYNRNIPELDFNEPNIYSYDINSMYPWIMYQCLPYGDFVSKSKTTVTWYLCTMNKVKWKEKYSYFSREPVSSKYYKSPVYLCEMYLNLLRELTDNDIEVVEEVYQECGIRPELRALIDKLFEIKSDPNISDVIKQGCKLTMNSQFGKFMERNYHEEWFYDIEKGDFIDKRDEEKSKIYRNNLTGVYIVQVAQSILINAVITEHEKGNTFVYCDTDSIKMIQKTSPDFKIGKDLGEWKFEGKFHIYRNNGKAKKYFLWNHDYPIDKQQIKMGGILYEIKNTIALKFKLKDYLVLFDRYNNVKIINGTRCSNKNELGQNIIHNSDIEFNRLGKKKDPTHILDFDKEEFLWKIKN